jgi:hypothetical protein
VSSPAPTKGLGAVCTYVFASDSVRFSIRFHANRIEIRFSVRHENRASTRLQNFPSDSVSDSMSDSRSNCQLCGTGVPGWLNVVSRNLELPKKINMSTISFSRRIGVDWCRIGNRTENRILHANWTGNRMRKRTCNC